MTINLNPDFSLHHRFRRASHYFVAAAVCIALLVLTGWKWDIEILKRPLAASVAMNPVTAVCMILSAVSIWLSGDVSPRTITANRCLIKKT